MVQTNSTRNTLLIFSVLTVTIIVFFAGTDTFQLFSVAKLSLDASGTRGNLIERGANSITGNFDNEAKILQQIAQYENRITIFESQISKTQIKLEAPSADRPPQFIDAQTGKIVGFETKITDFQNRILDLKARLARGETVPDTPTLPPDIVTVGTVEEIQLPDSVQVIKLYRDTITVSDVGAVNGVLGGGGVASSTVGLQGFQTLIREKVVVHDAFHTPANGQTIVGTLKIEWGHPRPITVSQFLVPNEYFDWFDVQIPQRIDGIGLTSHFDGVNSGEFKYKLTVPKDLYDAKTVIPIRLIIDSDTTPLDGLAEIQIERPAVESKHFSFAEFFRSFFAEIRV